MGKKYKKKHKKKKKRKNENNWLLDLLKIFIKSTKNCEVKGQLPPPKGGLDKLSWDDGPFNGDVWMS